MGEFDKPPVDKHEYADAQVRRIHGDFASQRQSDAELLNRALGILHRFGTERTGWRSFFQRWYYSDEPLRNDAANLVRQAGFDMAMPNDTCLVGGVTISNGEH